MNKYMIKCCLFNIHKPIPIDFAYNCIFLFLCCQIFFHEFFLNIHVFRLRTLYIYIYMFFFKCWTMKWMSPFHSFIYFALAFISFSSEFQALIITLYFFGWIVLDLEISKSLIIVFVKWNYWLLFCLLNFERLQNTFSFKLLIIACWFSINYVNICSNQLTLNDWKHFSAVSLFRISFQFGLILCCFGFRYIDVNVLIWVKTKPKMVCMCVWLSTFLSYFFFKKRKEKLQQFFLTYQVCLLVGWVHETCDLFPNCL